MRDILENIKKWQKEGKEIALATVVQIYGSALRGLGAKLAVSEKSEISGSVSGGCIESAVVQAGLEVIRSGIPRLVEYGVSNSEAMEVGLSCGGTIQIFIEKMISSKTSQNSLFLSLLAEIEADHLASTATILSGKQTGKKLLAVKKAEISGDLGDASLNKKVKSLLLERSEIQQSERLSIDTDEGSIEVFLDVFTPKKKLIIIGAVHIAIPLIHFARELDYECIVLDARSAFATPERFPHADRLIVGWPSEEILKLNINESSAIVHLTHDDKIDVPSLVEAVKTPAKYIGILGSKKTHAKRINELKEYGVTEEQIASIHAPIGLAIGSRGPQEIALSIMAEIIAVKNGK